MIQGNADEARKPSCQAHCRRAKGTARPRRARSACATHSSSNAGAEGGVAMEPLGLQGSTADTMCAQTAKPDEQGGHALKHAGC